MKKRSFYWHFENRADFTHALADYWHVNYTQKAISEVERHGGTAAEKLARIIELVHEENLTRYDLAFRWWALHDPCIAKRVKKTDRFRLKYLTRLFSEIGFSGSELEIRARVCLSFMTLENDMFDKLDQRHRADLLKKLHKFLLRN